jgi:hypothetical protein
VTAEIAFPGAGALLDIETRELLPAPAGRAAIPMPENFATRMFLVSGAAERLAPLSARPGTWREDFALAAPVSFDLSVSDVEGRRRREHPPLFVPVDEGATSRCWRIPARMRNVDLVFRDDRDVLGADSELRVRFRIPDVEDNFRNRVDKFDVLTLKWRVRKGDGGTGPSMLRASLRCRDDGSGLQWTLTEPELVDGDAVAALTALSHGDEVGGAGRLLGPCEAGRWAEIAIRSEGNRISVLFNGTTAGQYVAPETGAGTVALSQGNLLSAGGIPHLDIDEVSIRPTVGAQNAP